MYDWAKGAIVPYMKLAIVVKYFSLSREKGLWITTVNAMERLKEL